MTIYYILAVASLGGLSLILGVFTLVKSWRSRVSRMWFFLSIIIAIWSALYVNILLQDNPVDGFAAMKICYIFVILIPIVFFHFALALLYYKSQYRIVLFLGYIAAGVLIYFSYFTSSVVSGVALINSFGYKEVAAYPGFLFFLIYFYFYPTYAVYLMIKKRASVDGIMRKSIGWVIAACLVGFLAGSTNFIAAYDLSTKPFGMLIIWLYPVMITYGIFLGEFKIRLKK